MAIPLPKLIYEQSMVGIRKCSLWIAQTVGMDEEEMKVDVE